MLDQVKLSPDAVDARWRAWRRSNQVYPTYLGAGVAILGNLRFHYLDARFSDNPDRLNTILWVRLIVVGLLLLQVLICRQRKYKAIAGHVLLVVVCAGVSVAEALLEGKAEGYSVSFVVALLAYAVGVPTTGRTALALLSSVVAFHIVCLSTLGHADLADTELGNLGLAWGLALGVVWIVNGYRKTSILHAMQSEVFIAQLQQADMAKENLIKRLKEADAAKDAVFANVNHELRAPVNIVIDYLELLAESRTYNFKGDQNFAVAVRNAERARGMINDLLTLSSLDFEGASIDASAWSIKKMAVECVEDLRLRAERNAIEIQFKCEYDEVFVMAEYAKIEHVLVNLLTNALKFTNAPGAIGLEIVTVGEFVEVSIRDTGIGIPVSEQEQIFERGFQGRSGKKVRRGGVGIGLFMCRKIMRMHGSDIQLVSKEGKGSVFSFRLKRLEANDWAVVTAGHAVAARSFTAETQAKESSGYRRMAFDTASERRKAPRSGPNRKSLSVLIVEDQADIYDALIVALADDYDIDVAADGEEGLRLARQRRPALILSDVNMPVMDGFEMLQKIRQDPDLRDTPVIMLTAQADEAGRQRSHEYEADEYLPKTTQRPKLLPVIKKHLQRKQSHVEQAAQAVRLATSTVVSGLAHDIMNPISFIKSSVRLFKDNIEPLIEAAFTEGRITAQDRIDLLGALNSLEEGIQSIVALVKQLRAIASGNKEAEAHSVALNHAVQRALAVTSVGVRVDKNLKSKSSVMLRPGQLESVIVNLVLNAKQASGDGCHLVVTTYDKPEEKAAVIEVTDNGPGMGPDVLSKIFEERFTTKTTGSGLGLAMAQDILKNHKGHIAVNSVVGSGTTFTIWLPAESTP